MPPNSLSNSLPSVDTSAQAMAQTAKNGFSLRRINLLKSAPFRLGIAFSLLYLVCFSAGAFVHYQFLQEQAIKRIDASIIARYTAIRDVYEELGIDSVVKVARTKNALPMQYTMGFHLATADGIRIAGNVPSCTTEPGWANIDGADLGIESVQKYRFYTSFLGDNIVSFGRSMIELEELRQTTISSFLRTILSSTLLAILGAILLSFRTHRRINRIASSMNAVASGNLNARLPISSSGDDIDQLSSKMNDALDRLQQTVDSMRQVSTDIAHDLKTPLNRLYILIEQAAENTRAGGCSEAELDEALVEAQSINSTFEALLRIAQIEAGARKSQFCELDLLPILKTAAEVFEPVIEEHHQSLELSINSIDTLPMVGDRELLLQLVVNLVENAIRHCPANTTIKLDAGFSSEHVWFSIADNGPGVPREAREKVMQRLYRLESSRTTEGTGLGLSLVKAIADLHCGKVELTDNEPGLTVTISFLLNCPTVD